MLGKHSTTELHPQPVVLVGSLPVLPLHATAGHTFFCDPIGESQSMFIICVAAGLG